MKYFGTAIIVLSLFSLGMSVGTAHAGVILKAQGGRVLDVKALNVRTLEAANFKCAVPGSSYYLKPVGINTTMNYMIPAGVVSKTKNPIAPGQWLLGMFAPAPVPIPCVFQGDPPVVETVNLHTVTMYGTSLY